jgi:hypothetical protein
MRHVREVLRLKFGANDPREVARRTITTAAFRSGNPQRSVCVQVFHAFDVAVANFL